MNSPLNQSIVRNSNPHAGVPMRPNVTKPKDKVSAVQRPQYTRFERLEVCNDRKTIQKTALMLCGYVF